jgi:hypothetical protein
MDTLDRTDRHDSDRLQYAQEPTIVEWEAELELTCFSRP